MFLLWTDKGPALTRVAATRSTKAWKRTVKLKECKHAIIVEFQVVRGMSVVERDAKGENVPLNSTRIFYPRPDNGER